MPLASGTRVGPYEITTPLGVGGMGEVYRARDSRLRRDVAIKVLSTVLASDGEYIARFEREARLLASLNHPNIAAIYGLEENAIVMELVEGSDVRGPLPLEQVLKIAGCLVDAIEAAHEKGIIHRDLKPSNIKITTDGGVKVLDFGLAKGLDPGSVSGDPQESPTITALSRVGAIMGTAAYMAPEQARGEPADRRTDIWAFGAVLFELLTGKRAFDGRSTTEVLAAILHMEPNWSAFPPHVPARIRELLRLCLAKDRKLRLQAIGDARIFLNAPIEVAISSVPARTRQGLPWTVAGVFGVLALVAFWRPWRAPSIPADQPFLQMDLETGVDEFRQPAISPDGLRIAFVTNRGLSIRRLDQATTTSIAGTEGAVYPFFSPNGQWIAFFGAGKLQKVAVDGGTPLALCDSPFAGGGTWGADDYIVAALDQASGLTRISATGGMTKRVTDSIADPSNPVRHLWPQALPDGNAVLFAAVNGSSQGLLQVLTQNDGKIKTVVKDSAYGRYLPNGHLLYYQRGTIFAAPMDAKKLELTGPAVPLMDGVANSGGRGEFDLSGSGTLIYRGGGAGINFVLSWLYSSGKVEPLISKVGNYSGPRLSPDGTRLALSVTEFGKQNLWIYDLRRETWARLTSGEGPDILATWTSDSEFLAFRSGNTLAWTRSDGSGKVERMPGVSRNAGPYSFSADGKWLAFWPLQQDSRELWAAPVEQTSGLLRLGNPRMFFEGTGTTGAPALSPDGRWVAYTANESGRFEIYVRPFSPQGTVKPGKWQVSSDEGFAPAWSRSGTVLFYSGPGRRLVEAASYTAQGDSFKVEKSRIWSETPLGDTGISGSFDVAPDGKRVLAVLNAVDPRAQTLLHVLLNVDGELRRRAPGHGK